jgi:hypothetical protein
LSAEQDIDAVGQVQMFHPGAARSLS